jgi:hypothetical protein
MTPATTTASCTSRLLRSPMPAAQWTRYIPGGGIPPRRTGAHRLHQLVLVAKCPTRPHLACWPHRHPPAFFLLLTRHGYLVGRPRGP